MGKKKCGLSSPENAPMIYPPGTIGFLVREHDYVRAVPCEPATSWHSLQPRVTFAEEAYAILNDLGRENREVFVALYLDAKRVLIERHTVAIGTLSSCLVHPREVFRRAIEVGAHCIILAHNHPSGDPSPSPEDEQLTRRMRQAGELLGIEVLDHLVIGKKGYESMKKLGRGI